MLQNKKRTLIVFVIIALSGGLVAYFVQSSFLPAITKSQSDKNIEIYMQAAKDGDVVACDRIKGDIEASDSYKNKSPEGSLSVGVAPGWMQMTESEARNQCKHSVLESAKDHQTE